jgi:hypothetical protein
MDDPPAAGGFVAMRLIAFVPVAALCAACAGRDPMPIATVQQTDATATCAMIVAEIEANNIKVRELADEQGLKVGQNVAAGVAGVVFFPLWFGMDFKGAASKDSGGPASASAVSYDTGERTMCTGCTGSAPTRLHSGKVNPDKAFGSTLEAGRMGAGGSACLTPAAIATHYPRIELHADTASHWPVIPGLS